jgi:hypothetical protein
VIISTRRDTILFEQLDWCKQLLAENERNIARLLSGETHVGIGLESLKTQNEILRGIIEMLEPPDFPNP